LDQARHALEKGAYIDAPDEKGYTALIFASRCGHFKMVKFLLENGAEIEPCRSLVTALHVACNFGHWDVAQLLLQNDASVDEVDSFGCGLLLQNGADIDAVVRNEENSQSDNDGGTALHLACSSYSWKLFNFWGSMAQMLLLSIEKENWHMIAQLKKAVTVQLGCCCKTENVCHISR
jgi:hypothetical protein